MDLGVPLEFGTLITDWDDIVALARVGRDAVGRKLLAFIITTDDGETRTYRPNQINELDQGR